MIVMMTMMTPMIVKILVVMVSMVVIIMVMVLMGLIMTMKRRVLCRGNVNGGCDQLLSLVLLLLMLWLL
jgi:hypothetical protein